MDEQRNLREEEGGRTLRMLAGETREEYTARLNAPRFGPMRRPPRHAEGGVPGSPEAEGGVLRGDAAR